MKIISKNALDFTLTAEMISPKEGIKKFSANWEFGKVELLAKRLGNLQFYHSKLEGKGEDELVVIIKEPAILLTCSLHGKLDIRVKGLGDLTFHERGFNLVYAPIWSAEVVIRANQQEVILIEVPLSLLQENQEHFPLLDAFIAMVQLDRPCKLMRLNQVADRAMLHKLEMVINTPNDDEKLIWLNSAIHYGLELTMRHPLKRIPRLSEDEIVKMYKVKEMILNQLNKTYTLKELSEKVNINILRLKKDFRKIFGLTPAALQTEQRMKKAAELLSTSRTYTILQVAETVGYKYHTDFTRAFKHFYGFSPKVLSKKAPRY